MTKQELIDFLLTVDKQHIDELVDILTDFGNGRLTLNSTVKNVLLEYKAQTDPFTKKEIELLITEFQAYGGNTVANTFRSQNSSVSYSEILNDVFKIMFHNAISFKNNIPDDEKEKQIIFYLLGDDYSSLSFEERYKKSKLTQTFINNLSPSSIKKKRSIIAEISQNKSLSASELFKFAASIVGHSITSDPILALTTQAYRITVPFIVQIAWLKMKYQATNKKICDLPMMMKDNTEVLVINENEDSILSLREYAEKPEIRNDFSQDDIARLNQLFSNIPAVATKYETVKKHIVSINIDPTKLTAAKDKNGLRGMVHGHNKKGHFGIIENVRISDGKKFKQLVNVNLLMNVASTVVAQQHLADINEKLKEIQKGIEDIKGFLSDERSSKITSAMNEIKFNSTYLNQGKSIPDKGGLDILIEKLNDNLAIKEHLESDLRKTKSEIQNIKFDSIMGIKNDKDLKQLHNKIQEWLKHYQEYKLCCNVILMAYGILYTLDKEKGQYYADKAEHLIQEVTEFCANLIPAIKEHLRFAQQNAKGKTNWGSTELAQEAFVEKNLTILEGLEAEIKKELHSTLSINELKPIVLALQLENGKVTAGQIMD